MRFGLTLSALKISSIVLVMALSLSQPAYAATDAEVIELLKAQIGALTDRLDALESNKVKTQVYRRHKPVSLSLSQPHGPMTSSLKGIFVIDTNAFDIEGRVDRHRQRIERVRN